MTWHISISDCYLIVIHVSCTNVIYTDACSNAFGGYEIITPNCVAHGVWSYSIIYSAWREVLAVYRVLKSLVHILCFQRVKWCADNQSS